MQNDLSYCTNCNACTWQEISADSHERDSSGDYRRCLSCNYVYTGVTGRYEPGHSPGREHCYHDHPNMTHRGIYVIGYTVCCHCGHVRNWRQTSEAVPGHGRFFPVTKVVRIWEEPETTESCEEYEKHHATAKQ